MDKKKGGNNNQNLQPITSLTKGEAKGRGRNGGLASAKARLEKKKARETALLLLSLPAEGANKDKMKALGVPDNELSNFMLMMVGLYRKGINGDPSAVRLYMEIAGLMPDKELTLNGSVNFNGGNLAETLASLQEDD